MIHVALMDRSDRAVWFHPAGLAAPAAWKGLSDPAASPVPWAPRDRISRRRKPEPMRFLRPPTRACSFQPFLPIADLFANAFGRRSAQALARGHRRVEREHFINV